MVLLKALATIPAMAALYVYIERKKYIRDKYFAILKICFTLLLHFYHKFITKIMHNWNIISVKDKTPWII